ncbi:MAG: tRNA pseudouridine(13) synthase TruD [Gammaproteobacteria bacterium]|nr:tRNA pseudouridine(13) synthase TruD [Gammaproteobacteria bacterium]
MFEIPEWPYFLGAPQAVGVIRSCPQDFVVEEIPRVLPEGEGSHLWLWVEKCSANTDWVAGELARVTGCARRDVGYAGLKDRHAITRQWFSVPSTADAGERLENAEIEGVLVLESKPHTRKLKRGTLNGNRFYLNIREFKGDATQTGRRLEQIRTTGVPNYFGPQRFGYQGQNVVNAFRLLSNRVRLQRNKKSIYLSAIRSFLFNQVLAERVRKGTWNKMTEGELAMLDGTQSVFSCEMPDTDIEDRCRSLDIHPTGPMPGEKGTQPTGDAAGLEQSVLQHWPDLTGVLNSQRVRASRRALRLYPAELEWGFDGSDMKLAFVLPPGAYATTVLREILVFNSTKRMPDKEQEKK